MPRDTPAAIVGPLNREINLAVSDPAIKARLVELGGLLLRPAPAAEFGNLVADDAEKWGKVIRAANIKAD